jgi:hypothetical protein
MTFLILLVAAAGGIVVWLYEKRLRQETLARFQTYIQETLQNETLSEREKTERIVDLFIQNRFKILKQNDRILLVARREFSIGAALMWLSVAGVGLIIYFIWYFLKQPETLTIHLKTGVIDAK